MFRCVAVSQPLFYYSFTRTNQHQAWKAGAACLCLWIIATFLGHTRRFTAEWMKCDVMIIMTMLRSILPLLITAILNIIVYYFIRKQSIERLKLTPDPEAEKKFLLNKKAAITISLLVICIMMSYLPLRVVTIISVCGSFPGMYERLSNFIVLLKFINSIINPIIYMIRTPQFKHSIKKMTRESLKLVASFKSRQF